MDDDSFTNLLESFSIPGELKEQLKKRILAGKQQLDEAQRQRDEAERQRDEAERRGDEAERQRDELAHLAKISSLLAKGHAGCGAELALTLKDENKWPRNVRLSNMYSMTELKYRCCHRCGRQIYWASKSTKDGLEHLQCDGMFFFCISPRLPSSSSSFLFYVI
jgi:hypothetical protein